MTAFFLLPFNLSSLDPDYCELDPDYCELDPDYCEPDSDVRTKNFFCSFKSNNDRRFAFLGEKVKGDEERRIYNELLLFLCRRERTKQESSSKDVRAVRTFEELETRTGRTSLNKGSGERSSDIASLPF